MRFGKVVFDVEQRFKHFDELHCKLVAKFPDLKLPNLPTKKVIGRKATAFVKQRRTDIFTYLQELLALAPVAQSAEVLQFSGMLSDFRHTVNDAFSFPVITLSKISSFAEVGDILL